MELKEINFIGIVADWDDVSEKDDESAYSILVREYVEKNWHSGVLDTAAEYVHRLII